MLIIIILLFIILCFTFIIYLLTFYNKKDKDLTFDIVSKPDYDRYHDKMIAAVEKAVKFEYQPVEIKAYDGTILWGRLYYQNPDAPFHIQFHGYKGHGVRDFSGGMQLVLKRNDNLLLIDQRGQGNSGGHTMTFGIKEKHDVLSWINYILENFGSDRIIFIEGISMGAATVLMSIAFNLPKNVFGVWADCPYSKPLDIIDSVAKNMIGFSKILNPFFILSALLFGRFNLIETSAAEAVKSAKIPIEIVHGTGDHFVPIEMSRSIYLANPEHIRFVEFDGAPHGLSYIVDPAKYEKEFNGFIDRIMLKTSKSI